MAPSALIKLALSELGCVSVPDLFHALRGLAQPIGSAIDRQVSQHGGWICWGNPSIRGYRVHTSQSKLSKRR